MEKAMSWLLSNFTDVIEDFINGILEFFSILVNNVFFYIAEINLKNSIVVNATTYTTLLGISLITLIGVKQYFTTYVMETSGDPDSDPIDILVRCSEAIAVCCSNEFIATYFFKFSQALVTDLGDSATFDLSQTFENLMSFTSNVFGPSKTVFLILLLALVIGIVAFCFIAAIRGAEIGLMKVFFPIMAVDLVTANRERWGNFFISYAITFLYYGFQLLCYRLFISSLISITTSVLSNELLITFGWFIVMLRGPKWLDKFIYSSGLGRGVAETGRTALNMIPNFMRMAK